MSSTCTFFNCKQIKLRHSCPCARRKTHGDVRPYCGTRWWRMVNLTSRGKSPRYQMNRSLGGLNSPSEHLAGKSLAPTDKGTTISWLPSQSPGYYTNYAIQQLKASTKYSVCVSCHWPCRTFQPPTISKNMEDTPDWWCATPSPLVILKQRAVQQLWKICNFCWRNICKMYNYKDIVRNLHLACGSTATINKESEPGVRNCVRIIRLLIHQNTRKEKKKK